MKASEVIERLNELKEKHGDLDVYEPTGYLFVGIEYVEDGILEDYRKTGTTKGKGFKIYEGC